ncbi:hypothetical protein P3T40_006163 [Paraburkholderia sp. EB58]|jgi:hypothetical protein
MAPVGTGARISEQPLWRGYDDKSHEVNKGDLPIQHEVFPERFEAHAKCIV